MNALILAAGLGTRLRPLTDKLPKALVEVNGQTLLEIQIHKLWKAGAKEIVVNVHHMAEQVIDYIASHQWNIPIKISDEHKYLLDTGGGLRKAWSVFQLQKNPVLVHNVDILGNADIADLYAGMENTGDICAARLLVSRRTTSRYLLFDDTMRLVGWLNEQTGEVRSPYKKLNPALCRHYAFSGIHVVNPVLRPLLEANTERFSIIDFYLSVCRNYRISGFIQENLCMLDVGKTNTLAEASRFLQNMNSVS